MPQLNAMVEEYKNMVAAATHMLIIGPTKSGKSDYIAQAAIDGFQILYIDRDNGLPTLMERLKGNPEAMARVHYLSPVDLPEFMVLLCRAPVVRYNERTRKPYTITDSKPDDEIVEIRPLRMGRTPGVIVSIDSWTTYTTQLIAQVAKEKKVELTTADSLGREIYGPTGTRALQMAAMLQAAPFNFVLQCHPSVYEIKEKPPNQAARDILEKDMIIRDTWDVPQSTSGPNGFQIGKFFNAIGWLEITRFDKYELSFKAKAKRIIGGGPGTAGDPRTTHSYKNLFGRGVTLPSVMDPDAPWIRRLTAAEYQAETKGPAAAAPAAASTKPAASQSATPIMNPNPPGMKLGGIKLGNK